MSKKRKKNISDKILKFAKKNAKHESASEAASREAYEEEMEFDNALARKRINCVYGSALENPEDLASYFGNPEKDVAKFLHLIMEQRYKKIKVDRKLFSMRRRENLQSNCVSFILLMMILIWIIMTISKRTCLRRKMSITLKCLSLDVKRILSTRENSRYVKIADSKQ